MNGDREAVQGLRAGKCRRAAGAAQAGVVVWLVAGCSVLQHGEVGGGHDWNAEPQHCSVFVGSTFDDGEEAPTLGFDYEYRVNGFLGLGGVAEYAFKDIDATTLLAVADLHITPQFIVQTGPGIEWIDDEELFVYRVGMLYEWESGGRTISPQIHYDATSEEDAIIIGLAFGIGF